MYFNVRYYLVAILFILFDLEVAFVFPWAVVQSQLGRAYFVVRLNQDSNGLNVLMLFST
jgi:NADH:ubiquinone oxidoreductase subunit 3 (subunit A)